MTVEVGFILILLFKEGFYLFVLARPLNDRSKSNLEGFVLNEFVDLSLFFKVSFENRRFPFLSHHFMKLYNM